MITVRDQAGQPLVGAVVRIAGMRTVSDAAGLAVLGGLPVEVQYLQVSDGAGYCTYNSGITISAGGVARRAVRLTRVAPAQRAWLAQINAERAAADARPVAFDESAQETAAQHARDMAERGYVSHWDTRGLKPYQRYARLGGVGVVDENVAGGFADWRDAQAAFMAERAERGGHYANIVDPTHRWVGLASAENRGESVFDEEFVTMGAVFDPAAVPQSVAVGTPISVSFRSLGSQIAAAHGSEPLPHPLTLSQLTSAPYDGAYETIGSIGLVSHASANGTLLTTGSIRLTHAGSYLVPVIGARTWLASLVVMAR